MYNNQDFLQKYLEELSEKFPTKESAVNEIINLSSILALPRSVEHFMSDLHGQADAFEHILNNASGGIRFRIGQLFNNTLTKEEQDELATIIYYTKEKAIDSSMALYYLCINLYIINNFNYLPSIIHIIFK